MSGKSAGTLLDLGFCWSFGKADPETSLRRLRTLGFDGIELWPDALEMFSQDEWAGALRSAEMTCLQLCPYFDFMKGEPGIERSRHMLDQYLQAAQALGCFRLRTFTGPPWGEGVVSGADATPAQWDDAIRSLQEFCDVAARQKVELCLECHEGGLMENAASTRRLLDAVQRPNLTTNLQLPLKDEDWRQSLDRLAANTTHVHTHNWTEGLGQGLLTFLEEGSFDWRPVVEELLARGPGHLVLSVEHADHNGCHDPWESARRDGAYLNRLRESVLKS